jgi:hypothetical protein
MRPWEKQREAAAFISLAEGGGTDPAITASPEGPLNRGPPPRTGRARGRIRP